MYKDRQQFFVDTLGRLKTSIGRGPGWWSVLHLESDEAYRLIWPVRVRLFVIKAPPN